MPTPDVPALRFGSQEAAARWAARLQEISANLEDHGFDLAAEDILEAATWLAAYAGHR